ncbi:zinc-ribbon domain-containing protein [Paraclostridium sp. AKS73]|uniref:zinc-ribbon domain-containing protein n=1 Tax=Paraclostridium sp. AKS73 TaxID=2876116 RepID=UPI0021E036F7|nr:zinc-ribbon domain-containing protein [Paraclostridium sp. AKS73]MCU9815187.1 zinc-ribbon domain-containing protein [Paraclostridium sp. AKS73]
MEKNNETVFCSKCGHKNLSSDKFCSNCGNSLKSIEDSIKDATTNIKDTITNNETYKKFTDISGDGSLKADWEMMI